MYGNWKSLQQQHMLEFLTTWRHTDGLSNLVGSVLGR